MGGLVGVGERNLGIGRALTSGEIELMPEYTGSC